MDSTPPTEIATFTHSEGIYILLYNTLFMNTNLCSAYIHAYALAESTALDDIKNTQNNSRSWIGMFK